MKYFEFFTKNHVHRVGVFSFQELRQCRMPWRKVLLSVQNVLFVGALHVRFLCFAYGFKRRYIEADAHRYMNE